MQLALLKNKPAISLTVFLGLVFLTVPSVFAFQEDEEVDLPSGGTVFNWIELTKDGVVAWDTVGDPWHYDFELSRFLPGDLPDGGPDPEDSEIPANQRCDQRKIVQPLETEVVVGPYEYVEGDIKSWGRVIVKGWVQGDIQVFSGRVIVDASGRVDGDIQAEEIIIKEGAEVYGELIETSLSPPFAVEGIWVVFGFTLFFLFIGFVTLTLLPSKTGQMIDCISAYPVRSFSFGLLFVLLLPMLIVLVAITIVGILVLVFVPLIYLAAISLGVIGVSQLVGGKLLARISDAFKGPLPGFVAGLAILMGLWFVVAILLGSSDPVANGFGIFVLVLSILISAFPVCSGVGAAFLTRFGFRKPVAARGSTTGSRDKAPSPAPPPIPDEPPIVPPLSPKVPPEPGPPPIEIPPAPSPGPPNGPPEVTPPRRGPLPSNGEELPPDGSQPH